MRSSEMMGGGRERERESEENRCEIGFVKEKQKNLGQLSESDRVPVLLCSHVEGYLSL